MRNIATLFCVLSLCACEQVDPTVDSFAYAIDGGAYDLPPLTTSTPDAGTDTSYLPPPPPPDAGVEAPRVCKKLTTDPVLDAGIYEPIDGEDVDLSYLPDLPSDESDWDGLPIDPDTIAVKKGYWNCSVKANGLCPDGCKGQIWKCSYAGFDTPAYRTRSKEKNRGECQKDKCDYKEGGCDCTCKHDHCIFTERPKYPRCI